MKTYRHASALVHVLDTNSRQRLADGPSVTRPHALSEVFGTLTDGRLGAKFEADEAAEVMDEWA